MKCQFKLVCSSSVRIQKRGSLHLFELFFSYFIRGGSFTVPFVRTGQPAEKEPPMSKHAKNSPSLQFLGSPRSIPIEIPLPMLAVLEQVA